ncbi:MAG TPA: M6 family metalloprotease domain-containing protein [Acidobacteriota bacterium]|nr:M6 family metalloprotease domain-containing protein [Acidobacteriota bacterium]
MSLAISTRSTIVLVGVVTLIGIALSTPTAVAQRTPPPDTVTITTAYGEKLTIYPEKFHVYDIPADRFEEMTGIDPKWQTREPPIGSPATKSLTPETGRVLTVLVEWPDHLADPLFHPREAYDALLYSDGLYPTGSVNDYFQEVSYGAFNITGDVVGWVTLASDYDELYDIFEIIRTIDPYVNFADYDGNGDGYVDAMWLIHAGPGQEDTHNPEDIWSHAYLGMNIPTADGVAIEGWSMQAEEHANGDIISIRVFCHEYGHILGLPDLYDTGGKLDTTTYFTPNDQNDHPLIDWDVMGYAGYHIMSHGNLTCPSHFSAWSRIALGWATTEVPPCLEGTYDLYNIETYSTQNIFKIPITDDGTEYFLLEYRNSHSSAIFDHLNSDFSAYCPWFTPGPDTLDQGLLILHVDDKVYPNDGLPQYPNYAVLTVDAGYDPAHPWDGSEFTEWWYPYEFRIGALFSPDDPGQTVLSPTTTPSSDGYTGPSGVTIEVLSQNSDYLTIYISKPLPPVFEPVAPVSVPETEILEVLIAASDPNCTVPGLWPLDLPDFASFSDSGNGHGVLTLEPLIGDLGPETAFLVATDGHLVDTMEVEITVTPPPCSCPCHGDPECDGVTDVLDVVRAVNTAFRSTPPVFDPNCPFERTDVGCSYFTNVIDVVKFVNVTFRGGDPNIEFCDPCAP